MKSFVFRIITPAMLAATFVTLSIYGKGVSAQSSIQSGASAARGTGQPESLFGDSGIISSITNTLLYVVGALAVIMIIVGGIRYATSGGNSSAVTAAKNTILYAVVGLIVAFLAFAAVNFILAAISPETNGFTNV